MIVWDLGTWEPHDTDDPAAAVAAGELHVDVAGHKLARRARSWCAAGTRSSDKQWLLLHKDDDDAVARLGPRGPPALGAQRPDQRRGRRRTRTGCGGRTCRRPRPLSGCAPSPADAGPSGRARRARRDGQQRELAGVRRQLKLTNLDKEMFPGRDGEPPVTKRELIRYTAG